MIHKKVTIVGGGIGGLTLANALLKKGIDFQIFEAAKNYDHVGGGHWLYANALKTLNEIDEAIVDDLRELGYKFEGFRFKDLNWKTLFHKEVSSVTTNSRYSPIVLHRADIIEVLAKRLPQGSIRFDSRIKNIENNTLVFENGEKEAYDVLIGADGIRSKSREMVNANVQPLNSGQVGIWGIAEGDLPQEFETVFTEIWGDGVRVGLTRVGTGEIYWFMVLKEKNVSHEIRDMKSLLKENGKDFPKEVMEVILSSDIKTIKFNPLYDLPIVSKWYNGNVCCIGDAIHACTPNLGQGGCQAVEDGYWLAEMMGRYDHLEIAFQRFQKKRRKKTIVVVLWSRWLGKLAQSEGAVNTMLRNVSMRYHPKKIVDKILFWIMNVEDFDHQQ